MEAIVDDALFRRDLALLLEQFRRGAGWLVVRHVQHCGYAACCRCCRAGEEIFLVFHAGVTEVDMAVDQAGDDIVAIGIEDLVRSAQFLGYGDNLAVLDIDVADDIAAFIDKATVLDKQRADTSSPRNGERERAVVFKDCYC